MATLVTTLTQSTKAVAGSPCNFVLAITNNAASAININGIAPMVTGSDGFSLFPCNIDAPISPVGQSVPIVGGTQFNVQIAAGNTAYFPFSIQFFGPGSIAGSRGIVNNQYQVTVNCIASDGTVFGPPPLNGALNFPNNGAFQAPTFYPGQVAFSFAANSGLIL